MMIEDYILIAAVALLLALAAAYMLRCRRRGKCIGCGENKCGGCDICDTCGEDKCGENRSSGAK